MRAPTVDRIQRRWNRWRQRKRGRKGRAVVVETAPAHAGLGCCSCRPCVRDLAIAREQVRAGIIFTGCRDRDFTVQTCHTAADVDLADVGVGVGGVAVEGVEFRSFIGLFTRPVEQDEVNDTRDGIGTVNGRSAVFQDFRAAKERRSGWR